MYEDKKSLIPHKSQIAIDLPFNQASLPYNREKPAGGAARPVEAGNPGVVATSTPSIPAPSVPCRDLPGRNQTGKMP